MSIEVVLVDLTGHREGVNAVFEGYPEPGKTFTFHFAPGRCSNLLCVTRTGNRIYYRELRSEEDRSDRFAWGAGDLEIIERGEAPADGKGEALAPNGRPSSERAELTLATYPEIDRYMARAGEFVREQTGGRYSAAGSMAQNIVAEYMAFLDGKTVYQYTPKMAR